MDEQTLSIKEFPLRIHNNMKTLWEEKRLLDFTIRVGECKFRVHKLVLATCSDYFKAMFLNDSLESQSNEVTLKDVSPDSMKAILDFFYSSSLTITNETVQDILITASMIQLPEIMKLCSEYIKKRIDTTNCLGVLAVADRCEILDLVRYTLNYCLDQFECIVKEREFLEVDDTILSKLISHDQLNVDHEFKVLDAILDWISYDQNSRMSKLDSLIKHVRFALVNPVCLIEAKSKEILKDSSFCRDLIEEAKDLYILRRECPDKSPEIYADRYKPRSSVRAQQRIYAVGGWTNEFKPVSSVEKYNPYADEWIKVKPMSRPRCGVGVAILGDSLYALGGHDGENYLKSAERYDILNDCWYQDVADMQSERTSIGVVALNNYIYAIGGQVGSSSLSKVERYDPRTNTWNDCASMSEKRLGAGVAVLNGRIYVMGGADQKALKTVEYYDPIMNSWKKVQSMNISRKHLGCASYGGKIYAVGGRSDNKELKTAECYDPYLDEWEQIPNMSEKRSGIGLVECDGILYALGGHNGDLRLTLVEAYDTTKKTWTIKKSMSEERLGSGSALYTKKKTEICTVLE